ncbi:GNAT family N-acetyltransferase [Hyphococcus sp.]|uniref:GNAT family N-acetyltransferase n=1 Tax=Hyphococcus sp. TaxID=2038636 RepID=UPI003CCC30C3
MGDIEFVHLHQIEEDRIIDLMNDEMVGKQLPLLGGGFSRDQCRAFLKSKQQFWDEYGFGPWAFIIHGEFAGWGGLQPEQGEADFGLVLHRKFWGWGRRIFVQVKEQAFNEMNLGSIIILLPPSRTKLKAVTRLGFVKDGQLVVDGAAFNKFRLTNPER